MRTHIMVALASAIFAIVSKYGFFDVVVLEGISLDASRISGGIVTGIAFLGAGMIFVKFRSITGLTTAAFHISRTVNSNLYKHIISVSDLRNGRTDREWEQCRY